MLLGCVLPRWRWAACCRGGDGARPAAVCRELSTGKKLQEAGASVVGYRWLFASIVEGKLADATPFSL